MCQNLMLFTKQAIVKIYNTDGSKNNESNFEEDGKDKSKQKECNGNKKKQFN